MASDQEMRDWARANGYSVGERGRLSQTIIYLYNKAHLINAEVKTVTVTEIPRDYCQECWYESDKGHDSSCSHYVNKYVGACTCAATDFDRTGVHGVGCPLYVFPAAPAPPVVNPEPTDASLTALIRSIAATAVTAAPQSLDVDQVRKIAEEVALEVVAEVATPRVFNIQIGERDVVTIDGNTHAKFEDVVKIVGAGLHAYLVGPPGTGKTTLAHQVATALGLNFGVIQCDPTMPASKLFGFQTAGGAIVRTVFRDCYENGGVYLFDEIDNAHPGIIASINGAIANGQCAFPDGMVARHVDFRCVAAANTYGTGATRAFVGRNQLDAATLDRFVIVEIGIDEVLEEALTLGAFADNVALAKEWLAKVRGWRKSVEAQNLQVIVSPRASIEGATLLRVGFSMDATAEMKVWKGLDASTRAKIERGA